MRPHRVLNHIMAPCVNDATSYKLEMQRSNEIDSTNGDLCTSLPPCYPPRMTAQISDTVLYHGKWYALAETHGDGLIEPEAHGLEPIRLSTACWRGHHAEYMVVDAELHLFHIVVGLQEEQARQAECGTG